TWLVIGPVSNNAILLKGGRALNTSVLPMSLSVNHTCLPSGAAAMSGQKGEAWGTRPTMRCECAYTYTVSGVKLEQKSPYMPSGDKIVMPGPLGTVMRSFGA